MDAQFYKFKLPGQERAATFGELHAYCLNNHLNFAAVSLRIQLIEIKTANKQLNIGLEETLEQQPTNKST